MTDSPDWARVTASFLRKVRPEVAMDFLESPEWHSLPQADRDRVYLADLELDQDPTP